MTEISDYAAGGRLRRWMLVDGYPRCPYDAIDPAGLPGEAGGILASNATVRSAVGAVEEYEAAARIAALPLPQESIGVDEGGDPIVNPDYAVWLAATEIVANASGDTLALAAQRAAEPSGMPIPPDPLAGMIEKAALKALAAATRYALETGGITVSGVPVRTDRQSQSLITGAHAYAMTNAEATIRFKASTGFVELTASQMIGVATAVAEHVQSAFAIEAEVSALIDAEEIVDEAGILAAFA